MNKDQLLEKLWEQYVELAPSAKKVHQLFLDKGETVENDHIALRTFNDPRVNVDKMSEAFLACGYEAKGEYVFEAKKLFAKHYEHKTDKNAPRIFISELRLEQCSEYLQEIVDSCMAISGVDDIDPKELAFKGRLWGKPSYGVYQRLLEESEYAAWMYVYGFCTNHFTVYINPLQHFDSVEEVNTLLKDNGFKMNASGGEIKGTPEQLLEQSSILADKLSIEFVEGTYEIPACYYEFAKRYPKADGELFSGFVASSADKIFESTNVTVQSS
ncbi:DUF1338 domain-containing protein [Algivirga pacifica]|uniref:2-oxoadipate dioxygenase/decarboxylase n=1 Tax=Algivirga pacifica TaxID=1162670 RepID=A0ABP9D0H2_9BACT